MHASAPPRVHVLGALSSSLVAVGSFGVGAVPAPLAGSWLHEAATGRALSYALVSAGVLGVLWAWWLLRSAPTRSVLVAAAAWSVPLLVSAPLFSRDVFAYAGQGHLVDVGLDPYAHGPADADGPLSAEVDDVWAHARSPYGPLFLRLASWLVPGEHVVLSILLLRLLAVCGLPLVAWGVMRLSDNPGRALWLTVANPLVLLHGVAGAHNDLLMAGLLVTGVAVAASSAPSPRAVVTGTALVTAAALVKAPAAAALVFLPFVVATARLRAAVTVVVTAAVTAAVLTTATGLGWGWLHTLGAGNARRSLLSLSTGVGVLASNVAGDGAVDAAHAVGVLLAGALALWLLVRAAPTQPLRALGLTLLGVAVLGPVVQPWYLLWSLPVLGAVAGPRLAAALAAASAVLCLLVLPSGRHVIRPPLYGVPALVVVAAGCAAARRPTPMAARSG